MNDNSKVITAFLVGAAIGGAIAWFLTSEKSDELKEEIKDAGGKMGEEFDELIDKGKKFVEEIKSKATESFDL